MIAEDGCVGRRAGRRVFAFFVLFAIFAPYFYLTWFIVIPDQMNIRHLSWLLAIFAIALPLLSGCSKETGDKEEGATVVVHGRTLDKATVAPIMGIRVVLNAYSTSDSRTRKPVQSDTTYTRTDGLFEIITTENHSSLTYELVATDVEELTGGRYSESVIGISLSPDSPSFNPTTNTYHMEGNDFYMEKK